MSPTTADHEPAPVLDVRRIREPDRRSTVFAAYQALPVGESLVLVNDYDPDHLREEFEADHAGSYDWKYLRREARHWRIRITKLTTTPLPRILTNTNDLPTTAGVVWKLQVRDRDLDSNLVALPPDGTIDAHTGPDLDVLVHVLAGTGQLATERGELDLEAGTVLWLPRRSRRQFTAGPEGLRYLTVHGHRQALVVDTTAYLTRE